MARLLRAALSCRAAAVPWSAWQACSFEAGARGIFLQMSHRDEETLTRPQGLWQHKMTWSQFMDYRTTRTEP